MAAINDDGDDDELSCCLYRSHPDLAILYMTLSMKHSLVRFTYGTFAPGSENTWERKFHNSVITNKYDVNFELKLDYQSMLEMSYGTRGNRKKLVPSYVNMNSHSLICPT